MNKVTVKITKSTSPLAWYANLIGETFEVYDGWRDYTVVEDYDRRHGPVWRHINKGDCTEVKNEND